MAKIYDAVQLSLNRSVAIKFLSQKLIAHQEAKELFEHESLIIAQLNHPNIVQVIDKGITEDLQPYFVMEKINGLDLSTVLNEAELPFNKKMDIALQLCKGLAYAHKNSVIHRDIKPSNIIIDQHGDVKILDFGIALVNQGDSQVATATTIMGTKGYVAPEQQDDYSKATIASDIFSLGVLFNNLFNPKSNTSQSTEISSELKALIQKCCHPSPTERYQSLTHVRDQLLRISQGSHLGQSNIQTLQNENKDLASNFNLLDVLSQTTSKRVYLFQKKSNKQLLVIRRSIGDLSGLKEAKLLSSLKHPNIINIFAAVKKHNNATIITEYLSGGSLSNQLIVDLYEPEFLKQACKICSAIDYAHQNNILHKNLSPSNILFDDKQNPKVCDFGQSNSSNDNPQAIKAYQPPGQQGFSEQYDIYSMGAIFHHMLFGVPPNQTLPSSSQKVSFRLQKLIDKMIALDPLNRPNSAQEIFVELQRISNLEVNKRPRSNIGKKRKKDSPKTLNNKISKQTKTDHTKWLAISLVLAILCIIGLLAKDFIK
ncbi:protein kinase domain-containing protein [Aliikangiella sp. IMCC44359]|uniref:protein kinase domain-containing protein n=1 Tax=Aliikangiella sp. IMCC44359 TaxID=3459125 RepID=UPI00403A8C2B